MTPLLVTVVGGGMITHDQILPSLFHLQRQGVAGAITICALQGRPLQELAESALFARAFPGQSFRPVPETGGDLDAEHPGLYRSVLAAMPPGNLAVVAVPDHLHYEVVMAALRAGQHVLCVKPLVLEAAQSLEIEREARARGLLVGIEYHKRFDDRALLARRRYREGLFGEFKLGTARLLEKWYYRHSNFQNWCTAGNSDAFTYIGCHYVDQVHFITGLLPVAVSVYGLLDRYPNGNEGFLWTDARVLWSNGACLNVQNALGFPDAAPGTNTQGLTMYCSDGAKGAWIEHQDQYRGIRHCHTAAPAAPALNEYAEPSTDYFQYVDLGGPGLVPVGYGYRSIEYIVREAIRVESAPAAARASLLEEIDRAGILATPANSLFNELVLEAGRLSILHGGREARIEHAPAPRVYLTEY
jgi:predicted dehydrogenase